MANKPFNIFSGKIDMIKTDSYKLYLVKSKEFSNRCAIYVENTASENSGEKYEKLYDDLSLKDGKKKLRKIEVTLRAAKTVQTGNLYNPSCVK